MKRTADVFQAWRARPHMCLLWLRWSLLIPLTHRYKHHVALRPCQLRIPQATYRLSHTDPLAITASEVSARPLAASSAPGLVELVLALMLARQGIDVTLLEAHEDFDRDFRGDTIVAPRPAGAHSGIWSAAGAAAS